MSETSDAPVYLAQHLHAGYGGQTVIHDLSFAITRSARVGLLGPNGAGKTTLLRCLAGDPLITGGLLQLNGHTISAVGRRMRARCITYVPPTLDLLVAMRVIDFVGLGRTPYVAGWQSFRARDEHAVREALDQVDLTDARDRNMHELSEGERHRAMIAQGLAQEPDVLLLDEPTAHLDIKHAWQIMDLIHRLCDERGITLVMTTHDLNVAAQFCSHLHLLDEGRIAASGSPDTVLTAETLSRVYDHPIRVTREEHQLRILPVREGR